MKTIREQNGKKNTVSTDSSTQKTQEIKLTELETRIEELESHFAFLEAGIPQYFTVGSLVNLITGSLPVQKKVRKKREYTDEERKAIRDRLEAGKKAKQKNLGLQALETVDLSKS